MIMTTDETIEDLKSGAIDALSDVLFELEKSEILWNHRHKLGFGKVVTSVDLEIVEPRYGKVTDFKYTILADKDDYTIIAYYQSGSGYGVLSKNGNVCLEITIYDLVEWIVPSEVDYDLSEGIAFLEKIVTQAQNLIK